MNKERLAFFLLFYPALQQTKAQICRAVHFYQYTGVLHFCYSMVQRFIQSRSKRRVRFNNYSGHGNIGKSYGWSMLTVYQRSTLALVR